MSGEHQMHVTAHHSPRRQTQKVSTCRCHLTNCGSVQHTSLKFRTLRQMGTHLRHMVEGRLPLVLWGGLHHALPQHQQPPAAGQVACGAPPRPQSACSDCTQQPQESANGTRDDHQEVTQPTITSTQVLQGSSTFSSINAHPHLCIHLGYVHNGLHFARVLTEPVVHCSYTELLASGPTPPAWVATC